MSSRCCAPGPGPRRCKLRTVPAIHPCLRSVPVTRIRARDHRGGRRWTAKYRSQPGRSPLVSHSPNAESTVQSKEIIGGRCQKGCARRLLLVCFLHMAGSQATRIPVPRFERDSYVLARSDLRAGVRSPESSKQGSSLSGTDVKGAVRRTPTIPREMPRVPQFQRIQPIPGMEQLEVKQ